MALDTGALIDVTFAHVLKAEDFAFAAWSGAVTTALSVGYFGNGSISEKDARAALAAEAAAIGINTNTWQAYVGAMFKAADKLAKMAAVPGAMDTFHAISDMDTDDAVANVELLLRGLNMETGGHIRDWTKQAGLEPYNANAAKEARDAKALEAGAAKVGLLRANRGTAPLAVSDTAAVTTADPAADVLDALARVHTGSDLMLILDAVNRKLAELARIEALGAATAPTVAPVLADDAVVAKLSTLGRVKRAA